LINDGCPHTDYSGSWDSIANHQANVFGGVVNTSAAVGHYIDHGGVHPSKLVIGIPLYGRSFLQTRGPGQPFSGVGQGSWEAGELQLLDWGQYIFGASFHSHVVLGSTGPFYTNLRLFLFISFISFRSLISWNE
jgi:hypothetical protein